MRKSAAQRCERWIRENRAYANDRKGERTRVRVRERDLERRMEIERRKREETWAVKVEGRTKIKREKEISFR